MAYRNALSTYREIRINTASQGQLIIMLYNEAIKQLDQALYMLEMNDTKKDPSRIEKIGKAVVRNLVKRRIKEAFRALIPSLLVKCNYVVVAKEGIGEKSFSEIRGELIKLLSKFGHIGPANNE